MITLGDEMKFSIIVPIYKVENYIKQCVDSIIAQTYSNIEIILVDDGSPDNCSEICDEYASKDHRIKVIHQENKGLIEARKSGLRAATGEYVCFVDGDDWIEPDMYEHIYNAINQYNPDCVITQFYYAYEDKNVKSDYNLNKEYYNREEIEKEVFPTMLFKDRFYQFGIYPCCWTKAFKRDIVERNLLSVDSRIRLGEDIAFTFPSLMECNSIAFIDKPLYYYRQNPQSMTATYDSKLPEIYLLPYLALKQAENYCGIDLSEQLPYYLLYLTNFVLRNEASKDNSKSKRERNAVLTELMNNEHLKYYLNSVKADVLPFHTKILFFSLKSKSLLMLHIYSKLLKLSF